MHALPIISNCLYNKGITYKITSCNTSKETWDDPLSLFEV
jgi:hypothetical protein